MSKEVILGGIYRHRYDLDIIQVIEIKTIDETNNKSFSFFSNNDRVVIIKLLQDITESWGLEVGDTHEYDIETVFLDDYEHYPQYETKLWKVLNE